MTVGIPSTFTPLISRQSLQHLATVFAPSTLSKDVLNKLIVSSLTKVEIKSTNCVPITLPSPLGTVSDLTSVDQLSCRNLTLEPNSNNAADVFFGQFPYLEELVISDHCCRRASTLVLAASSAHLRSIRIGADCYSQLPEGASGTVTLKALPVLESVVVGKRCFGGFSRLCVEGCPELTTVTIGELCDSESCWRSVLTPRQRSTADAARGSRLFPRARHRPAGGVACAADGGVRRAVLLPLRAAAHGQRAGAGDAGAAPLRVLLLQGGGGEQ